MRRLLGLFSANSGSPLRRNFVRVARANVFAQFLTAACSPILTRLYSPADFGTYSLFSSILALALAVCTARFDWSVPNARRMTAAMALMVFGLMTVTAISLLGFVGVFAAQRINPDFLGGLGNLAYLLPIAVVGGGIIMMFEGWSIRVNDLRLMSRARIGRSAANTAMNVAGGLLNWGSLGLSLATVISGWLGVVSLVRNAPGFWENVWRIKRRNLLVTLDQYWQESAWSTIVALVNAASFSAIIITLTASYDLHQVGWYTLMYRLAATPIGLIGASLGQSFWGTAAQLARARQIAQLRSLYLRSTRRLLLLVIPICIGCFSGPFIVGPIFGEREWGGAGMVLLVMAPMLIGSAVFSSTSHLTVLRKQHVQLLADALRLILVVFSVVICANLGYSFQVAVFFLSLSSLVGHVFLFLLHLWALRIYEQ